MKAVAAGFSFFGANLRHYRKTRNLTQLALSALAGSPFTQAYLSCLERGLTPTDVAHVDVLARVLEVSRDALLRRPRGVRLDVGSPLRDSRARSRIDVHTEKEKD